LAPRRRHRRGAAAAGPDARLARRALPSHREGGPRSVAVDDLLQGARVRRRGEGSGGTAPVQRNPGADPGGRRHVCPARREGADLRLPPGPSERKPRAHGALRRARETPPGLSGMRIATWNVNSLKARLAKVRWWLERAQ